MYPTTKNYIVESGLNAKEIETGTMAESLELPFRLYLYLLLCQTLKTYNARIQH